MHISIEHQNKKRTKISQIKKVKKKTHNVNLRYKNVNQ